MNHYEQPDDHPIEEYRIPSGRHRGKLIGDLDFQTLHYLWASWNGLSSEDPRYIVSLRLRRHLDSIKRGKGSRNPGKEKPSVRKESESTHYRFIDPLGNEHWILNDVDMNGRENEGCPFDVDSSLDREFASIIS